MDDKNKKKPNSEDRPVDWGTGDDTASVYLEKDTKDVILEKGQTSLLGLIVFIIFIVILLRILGLL